MHSSGQPTPHCGQPRPHQQWVRTHELHESTKRAHRLKTHLGKYSIAVDSCTTTHPWPRRGHGLTLADLRIADNHAHTNNGCPPTKSRVHRRTKYETRGRSDAGSAAGARVSALLENVKAPPASSWTARQARPFCGRARAWTTGPGGSTSGRKRQLLRRACPRRWAWG